MTAPLLDVRDLTTWFHQKERVVRAVDGISYTVDHGQAVAIVGESGSGKSVSVRSLLGLLPKSAQVMKGRALFEGQDLLAMREPDLRRICGSRIGMVFQNAMDAMNPTMSIERQLTEHLRWHGICGRAEARQRAIRALGDVGIPEPERRMKMYPFQLSGGMRQRAMIAMAMVAEPVLLIADEPTTAVDVTIQRQILDLLRGIKDAGMAIVMITHDLGVARYFCDDAIVMYAGKVMEQGRIEDVLMRQRHPYTRGLLSSSVQVGDRDRNVAAIPGNPPDPGRRPDGCPFHPRCQLAELPHCREEQPLVPVGDGHRAACWKVTAVDPVEP